jgi:alkylation response protein AidB-like acyl-CoA dehydrogenase
VKFHLSPEQEALQDTILRTIERICPPARRRELLEAGLDDDPASWGALMDAGLGGLLIPEGYGGTALGLEAAALALEIVGRTATPGPYLGHLLAGWAIAQSDNEDLKARWLPKLAAGEAVGAVALDGWTPDVWRLDASGGRLSGEINLVPGAGQAQVMVVGVQGGLAVVDTSAGVEAEPVAGADPTRRLWTVKLSEALAQPIASNNVGQRLVDAGLVLMAADALGGAEQCLTMSVEYAKQREQFGVVIGRFQALKHQLANMALEVEPARALVWYAAYAWDLGLPDASRVAAHAKAHLCDRFVSVARAAVQAHGGIGYTWDYDLQIWFKRSLFDRAFLGAPSLHRERAATLAGW